MSIHVIPLHDSREHEQASDCWCLPLTEYVEGQDGIRREVVTHNANDFREFHERLTGKGERRKQWGTFHDEPS